MSALNPEQFGHITHEELAGMYSGDYDEPMTRTLHNLRSDWSNAQIDQTTDNVHSKDVEFGGPDNYIAHLREDITENGLQVPLQIRGGNVVKEGHHRGVALMQLRVPKIPVEHIQ